MSQLRIRFALLWAVSTMLSSCGDAKPHQPLINPSDAFQHLYEQAAIPSEDCERIDGFGCGRVQTSGTLVHGSFVFERLYSQCWRHERGFTIDLKNTIDGRETFSLRATVAGLQDPQRVHICQGISLESGTSAQAGSCDLMVKVHSDSVAASDQQACVLQFTGGETWAGSISCKLLANYKKFLVIHGESRFQCPTPT